MPGNNSDPKRRRMLAVVHMAVKQLAIDDEDYREILRRVTGRGSAGDCTPAQLHRLITELERLGYRGKSGRDPTRAGHPVARKARALWLGLYALGVVHDPSERALEKFGKRQLGVDRLHWVDQSRAFPLIEALKARAEREGWSQRVPSRASSAEEARLLTERLCLVLVEKLAAHGVERGWPDVDSLDNAALYRAVDELGALWRETKSWPK